VGSEGFAGSQQGAQAKPLAKTRGKSVAYISQSAEHLAVAAIRRKRRAGSRGARSGGAPVPFTRMPGRCAAHRSSVPGDHLVVQQLPARRRSGASLSALWAHSRSRASFSGQVPRFVGGHRGVDDDAAETAAASGEAAVLSDRSLPSGAGAGRTPQKPRVAPSIPRGPLKGPLNVTDGIVR
jgi:hypothetical protein